MELFCVKNYHIITSSARVNEIMERLEKRKDPWARPENHNHMNTFYCFFENNSSLVINHNFDVMVTCYEMHERAKKKMRPCRSRHSFFIQSLVYLSHSVCIVSFK